MLDQLSRSVRGNNMMWFGLGRSEGFPTQYDPQLTPVTVDVLEAGLVAAFLILTSSFVISLPTSIVSKAVNVYIRVITTLLIGLFILCNFGQEWEVSHIKTTTPYRAGIAQEINATIGVKIGLRSVNVTLKAIPPKESPLQNETIDYNERFEWTWDQGRFGFGPYAGKLQQEFRAAQYRGIPTPILWVVEYFVIDGEGFRYGRFYRTAGWYCHISLWIAFAAWILSIIIFKSVLRYGAYWLGACGLLKLLSNLLWIVIRNPKPLEIPFEDAVLKMKYGVSFWLTFVSGVCCCLMSLAIIIMESKMEQQLHNFFDLDPFVNYDLAYLTKEEEALRRHKPVVSTDDIPLVEPHRSGEDSDPEYLPVYVRRRTIINNTPPKISRSNKPKHLLHQV